MHKVNIKKGIIFLIVAPSGAGKSSLVKALLEKDPSIELSISYTTRSKREGETQGKEYYFVNFDEFMNMQADNHFVEYANVHGNFYGTSKMWLEKQLSNHKKILLEIDWQGANQVKQIFERISHVIYIFILPPSIEELQKRLISRGQDSIEVIQRRIHGAFEEITHAVDADYIIINEEFDRALEHLCIITQQANLYTGIQFKQNKYIIESLGIE
jgi:guanylate kinase